MIDLFNARLRARKLLRLLDDERALLLSGQLAALPALSAARDQLFQSLGHNSRANTKVLAEFGADVKARAERNHRLIGAALDGIRAADHLGLVQGDASLQTYTAAGKRVAAGVALPGAGRRS